MGCGCLPVVTSVLTFIDAARRVRYNTVRIHALVPSSQTSIDFMSMRRFLVSVEPPEVRVAEVRDGELLALYVEREKRLVGDIFKGVVRDIVPGMDAAFVSIGRAARAGR